MTTTLTASSVLSDIDIVKRVRSGEPALFEILMRRHNHRLYRAARAVIRDEADIEDVMQQAYLRAFTHLDQFEERALFSTWLTRILLNVPALEVADVVGLTILGHRPNARFEEAREISLAAVGDDDKLRFRMLDYIDHFFAVIVLAGLVPKKKPQPKPLA